MDEGALGEGGIGDAGEQKERKRNETAATGALEKGSKNVGHLTCLKAQSLLTTSCPLWARAIGGDVPEDTWSPVRRCCIRMFDAAITC